MNNKGYNDSPASNGILHQAIHLEKPTHPPPIIPNRPPPVGFSLNNSLISNRATPLSSTTTEILQQQQEDIANSHYSALTSYPPDDSNAHVFSQSLGFSSPQQTHPMQCDMAEICNTSLNNNFTSSVIAHHEVSGTRQPPKPIIPRKPGSIVSRLKSLSTHFGHSNESAVDDCLTDASLKPNEITSL